MTDEEFEEARRSVPKTLSKKRGISPGSDSEAERGRSRSQQSEKKKKTFRSAESERSGSPKGECMKAS